MPAATAIHFFLELAVILVACRVVGLASQRLGQPQVVGEMIAGVLLGPSLLGRIAPDIQHHLFPPGPANVVLYTAAQIGLVLYMFLIGLNFDVNLIKHRVGTAVAVSAAGILTPLALGALIAAPLLASGIYFDKSVTLIDGDDVSGRVDRDDRVSHAGSNHLRTSDFPERPWERSHWRAARPTMRCPGAFWRRCSPYTAAASPSPPRRSSAESCTRCCS